MSETPHTVTKLLLRWGEGDRNALDALTPMIYSELRQLAGRYMRRERAGHTLESTALVHEAFLRLIDQNSIQWKNRNQFFAIASQMIRRILVDHARNRMAAKRGAGAEKVHLEEALVGAGSEDLDIVALDDALKALAATDEQQSRMVELRFFGGLTIEETAEVLGISPATVKRDWLVAKAFLKREMLRGRPKE